MAGYDWTEINKRINGQDIPGYQLTFKYDDGSPCYSSATASVEVLPQHKISSRVYLENQGVDCDSEIWVGEVGATNYMAEYLSNGWDRFFVFYSNDPDEVFDEVEAYLDELAASGNASF